MGTAYGIAALACVVRRHGGRLPIARFLQFDQPKRRLLRATERSRPGASAPTRARQRGGVLIPLGRAPGGPGAGYR